jgi:arylsulfatase A
MWFAVILLGMAAAMSGARAAVAADADPRPNLIVILADDLGWGDLASYGHPTIQSPNLDRLAAEGLRFTDFYAASPVCSPARAGLLTGRIPSRTGIYDWIPPGHPVYLPVEETTIAELLRDAGYQTGLFGKWHLNGGLHLDQPQPDDHGFDHFLASTGFAMPSHRNPFNLSRNGEELGPTEGYACQIVTDEAIRWLEEDRDPGRPFFQLVSFHEPHEPIASPPDLVARYPDAESRNQSLYFANVSNIDLAVGRLLEALDELGIADHTMVLFTSDNGPETLDRHPQAAHCYGSAGELRGRKLQLWEGGIRVPGILRWPDRVSPGGVSDTPLSAVDLLPTLCEMAGVQLPEGLLLDGSSFLAALDGGALDRRVPLFWHYYQAWTGPRVALRQGNWKLVGYWDGPDLLHADSSTLRPGDTERLKTARLVRFELYDLATDPGEGRDLAAAEPERLREMTEVANRLHEQIQRQARQWPESWLRRW